MQVSPDDAHVMNRVVENQGDPKHGQGEEDVFSEDLSDFPPFQWYRGNDAPEGQDDHESKADFHKGPMKT